MGCWKTYSNQLIYGNLGVIKNEMRWYRSTWNKNTNH